MRVLADELMTSKYEMKVERRLKFGAGAMGKRSDAMGTTGAWVSSERLLVTNGIVMFKLNFYSSKQNRKY